MCDAVGGRREERWKEAAGCKQKIRTPHNPSIECGGKSATYKCPEHLPSCCPCAQHSTQHVYQSKDLQYLTNALLSSDSLHTPSGERPLNCLPWIQKRTQQANVHGKKDNPRCMDVERRELITITTFVRQRNQSIVGTKYVFLQMLPQ